jgi:hypothetical protein
MFKAIHELENPDNKKAQEQFTIESFDRMFYLLHSGAPV